MRKEFLNKDGPKITTRKFLLLFIRIFVARKNLVIISKKIENLIGTCEGLLNFHCMRVGNIFRFKIRNKLPDFF